MLIQVTTDSNIDGDQTLVEMAESSIEAALGHYRDRLTRVAVHFTDENSHKKGEADKRCAIEARPAGHQPVAVTNLAATIDEALDGAVDKLERLLEHTLGRLDDHKGRTPMGGRTT